MFDLPKICFLSNFLLFAGGGGGGASFIHLVSYAHNCDSTNLHSMYFLCTSRKISSSSTLLEKKSATGNPFCPVFRTLGEKGSQKGSLHVQEPKKVPYITKNGSKEPKKVLKKGSKDSFRTI